MPEWLMGVDCKSAGYAYAGSNPARPKIFIWNRIMIYKKKCYYTFFCSFQKPKNLKCYRRKSLPFYEGKEQARQEHFSYICGYLISLAKQNESPTNSYRSRSNEATGPDRRRKTFLCFDLRTPRPGSSKADGPVASKQPAWVASLVGPKGGNWRNTT